MGSIHWEKRLLPVGVDPAGVLYVGDPRLSELPTADALTINWSRIADVPAAVTALSGTNTGDEDLSGYVTIVTAAATYAAKTVTVNGHALSGNVTVTPTDLGLVIGTNVQAWDADLDSIAALTTTAFGRGLLTEATAASARTTLGAGSGSVTTVSVATANGVSGSVANATTTPAITLTLGAITPTTVNGVTFTGSGTLATGTFTLTVTATASIAGTHTGTSSGANTGDQTITLTGDVTGTGTGSFAATLATAQPAVHTWALAQTFTVAPVFTDQSGTRTALGLGTLSTQSGTFSGTSSGVNTGDQTTVSGNAGTATTLATPRAINGVSFNGSAAITTPGFVELSLTADLSVPAGYGAIYPRSITVGSGRTLTVASGSTLQVI